jgi:hypothetical protein
MGVGVSCEVGEIGTPCPVQRQYKIQAFELTSDTRACSCGCGASFGCSRPAALLYSSESCTGAPTVMLDAAGSCASTVGVSLGSAALVAEFEGTCAPVVMQTGALTFGDKVVYCCSP